MPYCATTLSSLLLLADPASGQAPTQAPAPDPANSGETANAPLSFDRTELPWVDRWKPERNTFEVGIYAGVMFPHPRLELYRYDVSLPDAGFRRLAGVSPEFGARLAYFPLAILGFEEETAILPTRTEDRSSAMLWTVRGHLLAQLPLWSIAPFAVAGISALGIASDELVAGNDVDMGFHYGGGIKLAATRYLTARVDVRDTITARRGAAAGTVHSPEFLVGLSGVFGRSKPRPEVWTEPPPPPDTDLDGILDRDDHCVHVPGVQDYDGCPIPDTDADGLLDPDDACVDVPGVQAYDGCPIPDTDADGLLDPDDACPDEAGPANNDGCPIPVIPDTDADGLLDPDDACPELPETLNGFEDSDGCPDELPEVVKEFTGVIDGIYFRLNSAAIDSRSRPKLEDAAQVLTDFPELRIEISGHTDDQSYAAYNRKLSEKRAEAVKEYLVEAGIDGTRIETRGAGQSEPIANNKTEKGRAKNRRIEFKLIREQE